MAEPGGTQADDQPTAVMLADPRRALVLQSRYADLMVVGRLPEANARAREFSALAGHLALHCPRPVERSANRET